MVSRVQRIQDSQRMYVEVVGADGKGCHILCYYPGGDRQPPRSLKCRLTVTVAIRTESE